VKCKRVELRTTEEIADNVKKFGGNFNEIFEIGYEKWIENIPSLLVSRRDYYQKLYGELTYKLHDCTVFSVQTNSVFNELYKIYQEQGRNIEKPSAQDRNWIKARLEKTKADNGGRYTPDQFFEYCRKRYLDDKQKRLEVEE